MVFDVQEQRAKERLEQKRERKAARTLAIITGSFISCWLPFFILAILRPFCADSCYTPPLLMSIINWLGYFNSLLNPIIYTIFNPDFRSAFRKILFGKYRRPRARHRPGASAATTICQLDWFVTRWLGLTGYTCSLFPPVWAGLSYSEHCWMKRRSAKTYSHASIR